MLTIMIPDQELFDEVNEEFINVKACKLELEHSLISIRKWESKWHKPFLSPKGEISEKTLEEITDYIRCMTLTKNVDPKIYRFIPAEEVERIVAYIKDDMTATWFNDKTAIQPTGRYGEAITAEVIYYWMITLNIPVEFERWHLNQLLTLIKVINEKNKPKQKMDRMTDMQQRHALNQVRRAKLKSKG